MITKLSLKNFQIHKDLDIALDPHITTIIGPSDKGKSAIARALLWLCFNRPSGKGYITHGKSFCKVSLTIDGKTITRTKGKKNAYELDSKTFKAIGSSVPSEVESLLQVSETNFQKQFDPPFWFTDTPGQVSKSLNKIVNLDQIDTVLHRINTKATQTKNTIALIKERLSLARGKRLKLAWVKDFALDLKQLEHIDADLRLLCEKLRLMRSTIKAISNIKKERSLASNAKFDASKLLRIAANLKKVKYQRKKLQSLCKGIIKAKRAMKLPTLKEITQLQALRDRADAHAERTRQLRHLIEDLTTARREKWKAEQSLTKANLKFQKATKGKCPTCGQPLLQSSVQISTSARSLRSLVQRRKIGLEHRNGQLNK